MDDETSGSGVRTNSTPSPSGGGDQQAGSSYRIRRPSSSLISSTTSPMFHAPANPTRQPPPSPLAHHSRQRHGQNNINSASVNNHFGPGDMDDDVQPSSNSNPRARASSSASSSVNHHRSQSPLGSPDSTYWGGGGPSPSPAVHHGHSSSNAGYRAPLTPGGMCVVSSSTSDDIPPSPFSPEDHGGHANLPPTPGPPPTVEISNIPSGSSSQGNLRLGGGQPDHLIPSPGPSLSSKNSILSSTISGLNRPHHLNMISQQNPDLSLNAASSSSSSSFYISPLRNKIKKASSFERFSLAQAIHNNSSSGGGGNASNSNANCADTLLERPREAPLNLTENGGAGSSQQSVLSLQPPRNPVISSQSLISQSKKIPLTPKQKLLHRMQSGELIVSLSPPPPPQPQIQLQQQHSAIQQTQSSSSTSPVANLHQNLQLTQETLQVCGSNSGNNHSISNNAPHSPVQLEPYSYESLIRNRDDFSVQEAEALGKVVNDDSNPQEAALLYDPDSYNNYYYQNILADDIFSGNNANSSGLQAARQLLMMPPGNLQEGDQPHGQLEFVLGLSNGCDDNERGRDDDIQLGNEGNSGSHQHFLDQNDALNAMKSQNQADSTLRNLLMMEPMRNNHNDDSWLTIEYQNRLSSDLISRVGRSNCGFIGSSGSQPINSQSGQNSMSNSWINEWPRSSSSWQGHSTSGTSEGVQDQDEVMDMSMMEQEKTISSHNKRLQQLQLQMQQQNNDDGIDEMDLTNGLPLLSMSIPMDLQQPMSILQHTGSTSSSLHLQQHHNNHSKMNVDDDEPVNLIAANIEQELATAAHHQHLAHQSQSHSNYHQAANDSYTLQIQSHHPGTSVDLQHSMSASDDINGNASSVVSDNNIDERKFIRIPKNKDTLLLSALEDGHEGSSSANVIMDKPVQAKAFASLPSPLNFQGVHPAGWAVFTARNKVIQTNTRLGPVDGPLKMAYSEDITNMNATYPCLIMKGCNNVLYQLDRTNDDVCNWMKFVRQAHSIRDQNALVVEIDNHVYFVTNKEIPPKTELRVGFSLDYARKYGLPYLLTEAQSEQVEQSRGTNHSNVSRITSSPEIQVQVQEMQVDDDIQEIEAPEMDEPPKSVKMTTVYPCFECDQEFNLVEELQVHLDKAHKDDEPEEIFKPKKKVIKKMQQSSGNEALVEQIREPIIQETSGKSRQNQLMSADSSMGGAESSTSMSNGNSQRSWAETGTGKYFNNNSTSQGKAQDNSVSTGGGPPLVQSKVKCTMCYKAFLTVERLTRHMIVHSDEDTKPLKCNFCVKRFLTNSALAGHIKTHAEEGKCFECPMCQFSTQQLLCLKEHVQKHRNRDTGFFHCPQCSKRFGAYPMIRKHIRAFHGPRQFACDNCAMSFPTSDKLRLHQLKHSDHREFLCAECGRQFKRKDKLREHTKRVHEIKKKNIVELNIPKDKSGRKFTSKTSLEDYKKYLYKCQDCTLGFKRRGMLVNHLAKRHPEKQMQLVPELNIPIIRPSRNYFCMYCERIYKSSSKRKAHILKSHPGKPTPPQMRSRDAGRYESFVVEPHIPSHVGTIVQTLTDDGDPRQGIMNVSCTKNISSTNGSTTGAVPSTSSVNASLVTTTSLQNSSGGRKETVVGKIVGTPHPCPWCYRQYATRAKNLQHQRKQHINLMTPELQHPRTQKNNVGKAKVDKSHSEATAAPVATKTTCTPGSFGGTSASTITLKSELDAVIPDSSTSAAATTTIQPVVPENLPVNEPNVIGFLLTTNGDLGNLLPSEIVMLPVENINNSNVNLDMSVLQASQIITSSNKNDSNGNGNNTVISDNSSNGSVNVSVTHPILTQME